MGDRFLDRNFREITREEFLARVEGQWPPTTGERIAAMEREKDYMKLIREQAETKRRLDECKSVPPYPGSTPWKGLGEKRADAISNIESLDRAKEVVLSLSAEDQKELYRFMHESLGMRIY